ncbi:hypothetical protein GPK34_06980 [Secundilactobacillus kimchicus]|uniref:hypothetical protein n=1 Tax=Secundilactobacillus kimchicus TaxID=528209 RepID=UPI000704F799|nr:hypothetical protein [Secundilactobacillus kimchicus]MBT9671773.1 hypothetical protein [Secundilactobacillus kimchicus]
MFKKSTIAMLTLSAGLIGGVLTTTTSADAATWHKGMPAALRGTWKAKHTGPAAPNNNIIKIWSTSYAWSPSYTHSRNTRYAYLGHHKYRILEDVSWSKKSMGTTFKWYSKHHISVSGRQCYR